VNTLSDGITTVELPYDIDWTDRTELPIEQATKRSVTGKLIVMSAVGQYGRNITLEPPARGGWWPANKEPKILEWLAEPEKKLTLAWRGETHAVMFRHTEARAYESELVFYTVSPGEGDFIMPTFRFLTMEP
jgi:hypothetical protein